MANPAPDLYQTIHVNPTHGHLKGITNSTYQQPNSELPFLSLLRPGEFYFDTSHLNP